MKTYANTSSGSDLKEKKTRELTVIETEIKELEGEILDLLKEVTA